VHAAQAQNGSDFAATGQRGPWRLSRPVGFWVVATSVLCVSTFSTAPSSLYGLYAEHDHLSSLTITIVYSVYAVGIVVSLLLAGHISDSYGRRVVLLPALLVGATALVLEHVSPRVTLLIFGIATAVGIVAAAPILVWANLVKAEGAAPADEVAS
jgi:MFS family permease